MNEQIVDCKNSSHRRYQGKTRWGAVVWRAAIFVGALWLSGCAPVGPHQQRLVSQPNLLFSDTGVFLYQTRLLSQMEKGTALSGGAAAVGCTSCK